MFYFNILILVFSILFNISTLSTNELNNKSCQNLIKALDLNTGAYNKCLFSKVGENIFEDLKAFQTHYLNEIEGCLMFIRML